MAEGAGPPPPKNFFSNFHFFAAYDQKIALWGPKSAKFGPARSSPWGATGPQKFANVWPFGENILTPAGSVI